MRRLGTKELQRRKAAAAKEAENCRARVRGRPDDTDRQDRFVCALLVAGKIEDAKAASAEAVDRAPSEQKAFIARIQKSLIAIAEQIAEAHKTKVNDAFLDCIHRSIQAEEEKKKKRREEREKIRKDGEQKKLAKQQRKEEKKQALREK